MERADHTSSVLSTLYGSMEKKKTSRSRFRTPPVVLTWTTKRVIRIDCNFLLVNVYTRKTKLS